MKSKQVLASLIATALLLFASTAMAQGGKAPNNALRAGQAALSFGVPSGGNPYVSPAGTTSSDTGLFGLLGLGTTGTGGALGYHYMVTNQLRAGLNLGLTIQGTDTTVGDTTESATSFGLDIAPQVNYYFGNTSGTVAPFFFGQARLSTFSDGVDATTGDAQEAADNADKTFNQREQTTLSLQGGLGVEWFPVTRFSISGQVGLNLGLLNPTTVNDGGAQVDNKFGINLFTSALAANIYF